MSDVREVRALLGAAYADDPLSEWIFADPRTRADCCAAWYGLFVEAYADLGRITTIVEEGNLAAVCLWRAIDDAPLEWRGGPSPAGLLAALVGPERAAVVADALHTVSELAPERPAAYVNFLAVRPDLQGGGVGRQALQPVLATGEPVRLETTNPRNHRFYERAGFTAARNLRLGDGPIITAMWREGELSR